jgi:hypothetical protein
MSMKKTPEELAQILYTRAAGLRPGDMYQHEKGGIYILLSTTLREEDLEVLAIYSPVSAVEMGYSISFARPVDEFRRKFRNVGGRSS